MLRSAANKIVLALVGTIFALIPAVPVLAYAPSIQPPIFRPVFILKEHAGSTPLGAAPTQSTSENWSGYAATGVNNSFTSVSSSWVQPTLNCTAGSTSYSAYWTGLDGYNDQTVEQIGTEANCIRGQAQYYSWYEMYPQNPSEILARLTVAQGNAVSATVTYNPPSSNPYNRYRGYVGAGSYTLSLTDTTTGASYSTTQITNRAANRSSAEVVAEAPYSNGILPLANFGTINFSSSTVNGAALGNAAGLQAITMNDPYGMIATPSAFDSTKENFSITWTAHS